MDRSVADRCVELATGEEVSRERAAQYARGSQNKKRGPPAVGPVFYRGFLLRFDAQFGVPFEHGVQNLLELLSFVRIEFTKTFIRGV